MTQDREMARARVLGPGIALIIIGVLELLGALVTGAYLVLVLAMMGSIYLDLAGDDPTIIGLYLLPYGCSLLGLVVPVAAASFVIFGGVQLTQLRGRGVPMAAAMVAVVMPLLMGVISFVTVGCVACLINPVLFLLAAVVSGWALMTLQLPEVREALEVPDDMAESPDRSG